MATAPARDGLTRLLVDVCLDAGRLDAVRADPARALAEAGVPSELSSLVERRRGSSISLAVALSRPLPTAAELSGYVRERSAGDPAFADGVRREPRPILERAFGVRFHSSTAFRVTERDGLPELHVDGLVRVRAGRDAVAPPSMTEDLDVDIDVDLDVDIEVDVDVVVDIDSDIDVDIMTPTGEQAGAWTATWARRRARWRAADDRR